jgi:hypothetical protein
MDPNPGMRRPQRASDADRDQAAVTLMEAMAAGQIEVDELDQRLSAVYRAKTRAELATVSDDLPELPRSTELVAADDPSSRFAVGVFGGFARKGRWAVPRSFTALSMFGGGKIDLTEARLTSPQTRLHVFALFGGIRVVVPDNVPVRVRGVALFVGFGRGAARSAPPPSTTAPRLTIDGFALFGGIRTRRRRRNPR